MNMKNYIVAIVSLAVAIILTVGVLVPVINDSVGSGSGSGYTNTGDFQYKLIKDSSEEHTITLSSDGTDIRISTDGTIAYQHAIATLVDVPIIYGDNFVYMVNYDGEDLNYTCSKNYGSEISGGYPIDVNETVTLTIKNYMTGEMDGDDFYPDPNPLEFNEQEVHTLGYIVASNGDTIMSNKPVVATDSPITAVGYTTNGFDIFPWGTGTIDDMKLSSFREGTFTFDFTTSDVDGYLKIEGMKITDTSNNSTLIDGITYFFVPIQIGSDSDGMSPTLASMLSVIPLIVVVGLIVGTVGYFIRRQ